MKILLVDDHPLILLGLRRALEESDRFEVVGEARAGSEALTLIGRKNPEVVLLDMRMPGIDGLSCLAQIRLLYPKVKVVMLSVSTDPEEIQKALACGASGYIVKSINPLDLPSAVHHAVEGNVYHPFGAPKVNEAAVDKGVSLTNRELTIVKAVARGLSNQAIAKELWVTEQTVKFHLTNIFRKLGISNRTQAARWAFELGLAEAPSYERTLEESST